MARKKRRGSRRKNKAIPIAIMGPVVLPALTGGAVSNVMSGNFTQAAKEVIYDYTGIFTSSTTGGTAIASSTPCPFGWESGPV